MSEERRYRATISSGTLTLVPWGPYLATSGPFAAVIEHAEVTVLDLIVWPGEPAQRELTVNYLHRGPEVEADEQVLLRWAETVGMG